MSGPHLRLVFAQRLNDPAWNVLNAMAALMARLLDARLEVVPATRRRGRLELLAGLLPRRRGEDTLLFILPEPVDLQSILRPDHWTRGYGCVAAWVTDAWWTERIPHVARGRGHFDRIYVTEDELVDPWADATRTQVSCVPQGTNALDWGSAAPDRPVDLQRIGRQPAAWDDDVRNAEWAERDGVHYAGRPPFITEADEAMRSLLAQQARAKFVLAFSNRVSPAEYTHPTREYLTGRWTDALASGASVAGVAPDTSVTRRLLWPEATLTLDPHDVPAGMQTLGAAVRDWRPATALRNHLGALERLDWRWRARQIADDLGLDAPTLTDELTRLGSRIATLTAGGLS